MNFIDSQPITLGNYAYEEYVLDEISVTGEEHYVTKIMVEVESKLGLSC